MSSMAQIDPRSIAEAQRLLFNLQRLEGRAFRSKCQEAVRTEVAEPVAAKMKGNARTRQQLRAATTIFAKKASKPTITYGARGTKVAKAIAMGTEFGGRRRVTEYWSAYKGGGKPFKVKRRTTMQFPPHLGREGYFVHPMWRAEVEGAAPAAQRYLAVINRLVAEAVSE